MAVRACDCAGILPETLWKSNAEPRFSLLNLLHDTYKTKPLETCLIIDHGEDMITEFSVQEVYLEAQRRRQMLDNAAIRAGEAVGLSGEVHCFEHI